MVVGVLDTEDILELARLVLYLGAIVHLNRANIVKLNGEAKRLQQSDWGIRQQIVTLLYCKQTLIWT